MQAPEKLSLIGGSILLASTLVFTLKSQASSILPKVNNGMSTLMKSDQERQRDQQKQAEQTFNDNFQNAQQKGWQTGTWGTTKYYVDDNNNLYIGGGLLKDAASPNIDVNAIRTINLTKGIQFPSDISWMFNGYPHLQTINGLDNVDVSKVTNVAYLFASDSELRSIDLSSWHTAPLTSSRDMLWQDNALTDANLSGLNVPKDSDDYYYFMGMNSLHSITLSDQTRLHFEPGFREGNWKNGDQILNAGQLINGDSHPGTWIKQ